MAHRRASNMTQRSGRHVSETKRVDDTAHRKQGNTVRRRGKICLKNMVQLDSQKGTKRFTKGGRYDIAHREGGVKAYRKRAT